MHVDVCFCGDMKAKSIDVVAKTDSAMVEFKDGAGSWIVIAISCFSRIMLKSLKNRAMMLPCRSVARELFFNVLFVL